MTFLDSPADLKLLQNLLNPQNNRNDDSDLEEESESVVRRSFNPGSIGPPKVPNNKKSSKTSKSPYAPLEEKGEIKKQPKSVEEWQQLQEKEDMDILDSRQCPEYTVSYRQAVGTEDVYLQMGNRTASSASCEDMILDIMLPGETTTVDKMDLSITAMEVDFGSSKYRLKLPLSHRVDVDQCKAKYDKELEKLTLTLRLKREFDYVNF